jgi:molybdate transport system substrate-binding protein
MTPSLRSLVSACLAIMLAAPPTMLRAETATVAVAANFLAPLEALQRSFEDETGHELVLVAGSTGQLYAQIVNGAPFDVLLSADEAHVTRLIAEDLGDDTTRYTYAIGRLALWTREANFQPLTLDTLNRTDFRWLAIANAELAPYGLAAEQTLAALGLRQRLESRLVRGQSVAQTFAMAETGAAELALIALSQALSYQRRAEYFVVPANLHAPLKQDAVLLRRAGDNGAARAFVNWLRGEHATDLIAEFGYSRE